MKLIEKNKLRKILLLVFCLFLVFILCSFCTVKKGKPQKGVPLDQVAWPIKNKDLVTKETLKLDLRSAYGDDEAYHPKVIAFKKPWNGYYYWIAFTPYPKANQGKENPHILASNDMISWEEPPNFDNPLEPQPEGSPKYFYNSDTHLLYNEKENRLECFWRYVDDVNKLVIIYRSYTYDGTTWREKEVFLENNRRKVDYLSPVILMEEDKYMVWYVDRDFSLKYIERNIDEDWSTPRKINIVYENKDLENWHLDLIKTKKGYEVLISAFERGHSRNRMNLYYTKSVDNIYYDTPKVLLKPIKYSWNNRGLYRSSILYYEDQYFVFYSGIGFDDSRGIGVTFGNSIDNLVWLTKNNIYDFKKITSKTTCYE